MSVNTVPVRILLIATTKAIKPEYVTLTLLKFGSFPIDFYLVPKFIQNLFQFYLEVIIFDFMINILVYILIHLMF